MSHRWFAGNLPRSIYTGRPTRPARTRYMPAIIHFLGYNPLPPANTLAEQ